MSMSIVAGLLIPFLGTTAGAACVFFLKKKIGGNIQRIFTGFAALSVDTQKYSSGGNSTNKSNNFFA